MCRFCRLLANPLQGLLTIEPEAVEALELRIYMNEQQHTRLLTEGLAGYLLVAGFLGFMQEPGFQLSWAGRPATSRAIPPWHL